MLLSSAGQQSGRSENIDAATKFKTLIRLHPLPDQYLSLLILCQRGLLSISPTRPLRPLSSPSAKPKRFLTLFVNAEIYLEAPRTISLGVQLPTSGSYAPAIVEDNDQTTILRGRVEVMEGTSEEKKPSPLQRLEGLVNFRIRSKAIIFTSGEPQMPGGNADVVRATFRRAKDKQVVAVKKFRCHPGINQRTLSREYVHEVEIMAGLSHENIVKLVGFVEDLKSRTAWIVLSWEPNGNVREFLASGEWEIPERISLIKDVFEGVMYLHTRQPPICHGDLKSLNILVSSSYRAIITDFGSARTITELEDVAIAEECDLHAQENPTTEQARPQIQVDAVSRQLTLTGPGLSLRWAPPEVMNGKRSGLSTDTWAAGWVCWEIMTSKFPFHEVSAEGVIILNVLQGSLMEDCWAFNPKDRPDIARCWDQLKWLPSVSPSGCTALSTELLLEMGEMHLVQGGFEKATLLFQQALSLARSTNDQTTASSALRYLGNVYRHQAEYAQAEESYTRAHETCARMSDDLGQANTLDSLGFVYGLQSKYTQAAESYTQAYTFFDRIGNAKGRANTLLGMGELYRTQYEFAQAEPFYVGALEIYDHIDDGRGLANTSLGLGNTYRGQSKFTQAEESYNRAQEIYSRIGDDLGRANVLCGLGHLSRELGYNVDAASHFSRAKDLFTQIGRLPDVDHNAYWLAVVSPK